MYIKVYIAETCYLLALCNVSSPQNTKKDVYIIIAINEHDYCYYDRLYHYKFAII